MLRPSTRSEKKDLLTHNRPSLFTEEWEDTEAAWKPKESSENEWNPYLQVAIVTFYIVAWVANGALLQGVTTGFGDDSSSYNKPAAVTWFSYNFMLISGFVVWEVKTRGLLGLRDDGWMDSEQSLRNFVCEDWAGKLGIHRALLYCAFIAYMLMSLNVFNVLGLQCISISLSNAVYQLQTPITLALSVCCVQQKREWVAAEKFGILISVTGILAIVLPPLMTSDGGSDEEEPHTSQCVVSSSHYLTSVSPTTAGVLFSIASATIGGAYLVFWGMFSEHKDLIRPATAGSIEFLDTHTTLAAIGFCNLVVGWPILIVLHCMGLETFELPSTGKAWGLLLLNGLVEYAFDSSCAMAIYATSPITVAVVAPLTILLSVLVDEYFYGVSIVTTQHPWLSWLGALAIICGTIMLEVKPKLR